MEDGELFLFFNCSALWATKAGRDSSIRDACHRYRTLARQDRCPMPVNPGTHIVTVKVQILTY